MRTDSIDWLGILATDEEVRENNLGYSNCIINKWDTLQFYLKVISKMPGQALNTQYIICYSNRIDEDVIVDTQEYDDDLRVENYVKQLKNHFFKFNYEENQAGYFIAKNIEAISLNDVYYEGKTFTALPMIKSFHPVFVEDKKYASFEEVKQTIIKGDYVSKLNKYNTFALDNIPYLVYSILIR